MPTLTTIKKLYAKSNNQCAFPGCSSPLVTRDNTIMGDICHIKAKNSKGKRYDKNQTKEERHGFDNLILLCKNHHQEIDTNARKYTVDVIREFKRQSESKFAEITPEMTSAAELLLNNYNSIMVGNHSNVISNSPGATISNVSIKTEKGKAPKINQPIGTIGYDLGKKGYVKYLIDKYNEFSKKEKPDFNYAIFYENITHDFGIKWDLIDVNRFDYLVTYLKRRIDRTKEAKIRKHLKGRAYHTYEEHIFIMKGKK